MLEAGWARQLRLWQARSCRASAAPPGRAGAGGPGDAQPRFTSEGQQSRVRRRQRDDAHDPVRRRHHERTGGYRLGDRPFGLTGSPLKLEERERQQIRRKVEYEVHRVAQIVGQADARSTRRARAARHATKAKTRISTAFRVSATMPSAPSLATPTRRTRVVLALRGRVCGEEGGDRAALGGAGAEVGGALATHGGNGRPRWRRLRLDGRTDRARSPPTNGDGGGNCDEHGGDRAPCGGVRYARWRRMPPWRRLSAPILAETARAPPPSTLPLAATGPDLAASWPTVGVGRAVAMRLPDVMVLTGPHVLPLITKAQGALLFNQSMLADTVGSWQCTVQRWLAGLLFLVSPSPSALRAVLRCRARPARHP